jgi:hypothetical protein
MVGCLCRLVSMSLVARRSPRVARVLRRDFRRRRRFDENIHLLADVDGEAVGFEAVDDLQDARIDALVAGAGEGALGRDVGFEADELQRRLLRGISAHGGGGGGARLDAPGVLLVNVHTQVQRLELAQQQQRLGRDAGGGLMAASACATRASAVRTAKRRRSSSSGLMTFWAASRSERLS